jgi:hypothetical protein
MIHCIVHKVSQIWHNVGYRYARRILYWPSHQKSQKTLSETFSTVLCSISRAGRKQTERVKRILSLPALFAHKTIKHEYDWINFSFILLFCIVMHSMYIDLKVHVYPSDQKMRQMEDVLNLFETL